MKHRQVSQNVLHGAPVRRWWLVAALPLLLPIYGCGGGTSGGTEGGARGGTGQPAGTPLPDDLAGQWEATLTYVPAYYTGIVGTSDFIGSLGITLYLSRDGSYQFDLMTAMTYYGGNCFRTTRWTETGAVVITASDITFTSTHAVHSIMDSCGESAYVDPAATGTATYPMTRDQDQTGWPRLLLRLPTGEDLVLEKCRDCS